MANDAETAPLYIVSLSISVPGIEISSMMEQSVTFEVVERLATAVILGREILSRWSILSTCSHLLHPRQHMSSIPRCMSISSSGEDTLSFLIFLDGQAVIANADMGSEVSLVSRAFAEDRQYWLEELDPPLEIEVANGQCLAVHWKTTLRINVSVDALSRDNGATSKSTEQKRDADLGTAESNERETERWEEFLVLSELRHLVILSQTLLDSIGAFDKRAASLSISRSPGTRDLCMIFSKKSQGKGRDLRPSEVEKRENVRRCDVTTEFERLTRLIEQSSRTGNAADYSILQGELDALQHEDHKAKQQYERDLVDAQARDAARCEPQQPKRRRIL